jgi:ubiquinone/menaquinone biosynthesis C-methylase UbiE
VSKVKWASSATHLARARKTEGEMASQQTGAASSQPDAAEAIAQYRRAAPGYDRHMRSYRRWQRRAIDALRLANGDTVIDVACGTGLNFPALEARIGGAGRILGVDLSSAMLELARGRVLAEGWDNVTLIEAPVEEAALETADAALFSFTHDVLQSPRAVANVVAHLRPEACVSSVGAKYGARWNVLVNLFVRRAARPYVTTFDGLDRPWRELERYTSGMPSKDLALGGAYIASGAVTEGGVERALARLADSS